MSDTPDAPTDPPAEEPAAPVPDAAGADSSASEPTTTEPTTTEPTVKRHPIRGALWGLMMGVGLAMALIGFAVIAAGTLTPYVIAVCGVAVGVLWGLFAPPKKAKGPAPA